MTDENSKVIDLLTRAELAGAVVTDQTGDDELPVPPNGASPAAQAFWYAVLGPYDLTVSELAILEEVVACRTMMDHLRGDWEADGSPTMGSGSMGQPVTDPRVAELRALRSQHATLLKALALPAEDAGWNHGSARRRPGRPSRAAGGSTGSWGNHG